MQWCEINGRKYHVVGGRVSHAVVNPTFDPVAKAGAMHDYFRGNPDRQAAAASSSATASRSRPSTATATPASPSSTSSGSKSIWLFPTLGILYEELLGNDVFAITQTFTAFNRWLDDDWGFAYQDRIFTAPYITLSDLDWAISELEWAAEQGRAPRRDAPGRAAHRRRPGTGERPAQRPVLGARAGDRPDGGRARGRQRLLEQRLRATTASRPGSAAAAGRRA